MQKNGSDRWKGAVLGVVGSVVGLLAMDYYWRQIAPLLAESQESQSSQAGNQSEPQPLDSISLINQQYKDGESSTAALGRILYQTVTGKEPRSEETKTMLSYLVHWGFGMVQGSIYGATRSGNGFPDIRGGLAFATGLWLLNDELVVPLLGLQSGPTAVSPIQHANRLGAHLAYGLGTAVTTKALQRII